MLFGALVGALFLAVLLLIPAWGYSPVSGAAIVSVLPLASLAVGRFGRVLPEALATIAGSALLALGLVALALLPRVGALLPLCSLALCGAGLGLALPVLSRRRTRRRRPDAQHAAHDRRAPSRPRRGARTGRAAAL